MADIDAIQAVLDATPDGPWATGRVNEDGSQFFGTVFDPDDSSEPGVLLGDALPEIAEFVVAARTDIPALLARVRELEAAVQRVEALHKVAEDMDCNNTRHTDYSFDCPECYAYCDYCHETWPCPTIAALRGSDV